MVVTYVIHGRWSGAKDAVQEPAGIMHTLVVGGYVMVVVAHAVSTEVRV